MNDEHDNSQTDKEMLDKATRPDFIQPKRYVEGAEPIDSPKAVLAMRIAELKSTKKAHEELLVETNKAIDEAERELVDLMQSEGLDLFRVPDVGTFSTTISNYPSLSDTEGFIQWLDANGMGMMAKRTVHPMTLKGWVNDWLKEGKALPPSVNNFAKTRINFRKMK